jgi:heme A synthase
MRPVRKFLLWMTILMVVAIVAGPAVGGGQGGKRYGGTLVATPNVVQAGDSFAVYGSGYNTDYGNVVVGFTGGAWGSPLDANGNFSIADIPALSGDTLPPGTYEVTASQMVHSRWRVAGETYVTVVP